MKSKIPSTQAEIDFHYSLWWMFLRHTKVWWFPHKPILNNCCFVLILTILKKLKTLNWFLNNNLCIYLRWTATVIGWSSLESSCYHAFCFVWCAATAIDKFQILIIRESKFSLRLRKKWESFNNLWKDLCLHKYSKIMNNSLWLKMMGRQLTLKIAPYVWWTFSLKKKLSKLYVVTFSITNVSKFGRLKIGIAHYVDRDSHKIK